MIRRQNLRYSVIVLSVALTVAVETKTRSAFADLFEIREDDGNTATIEARILGEGQGFIAIERTDGRIEVVSQGQILKRQVGTDPEPISCEQALERLEDRFGKDKFRGICNSPYVVGLVLAEPLAKPHESNASTFLKKAVAFMKTVENVFDKFTNNLKIKTSSPTYPLVLLIFETDDDFMTYAQAETGGQGLSAGRIMGFYSGLSNYLAIRMSECHTFETPLHEAIHQQVHNRGIIQRLAPVPAWFNEGIATGFEGNGEKVTGGPLRISTRYARAASNAKTVNWDQVVADDKAFHGDVLAGEAYAHAWCIHWFLVTKYRKQYVRYLEVLSEKTPLAKDSPDVRLSDFEAAFGKRVGQLQTEFPKWLEQQAQKQKVQIKNPDTPGYSTT
ncbi:MAG: DUF1570 domain-containing protein, partial [Planctomycetes bacterium]|nr:DUF1570 domain-containing protein [Planctomycetota bacterium]